MKKYQVVEKHITYLTFNVEAENEEEAIKLVSEEYFWNDADEQDTEFENVDCQEIPQHATQQEIST